jgi:hypothetical protein
MSSAHFGMVAGKAILIHQYHSIQIVLGFFELDGNFVLGFLVEVNEDTEPQQGRK